MPEPLTELLSEAPGWTFFMGAALKPLPSPSRDISIGRFADQGIERAHREIVTPELVRPHSGEWGLTN